MKEWQFPTGEYGVIVEDEQNFTVHWDWKKEKDVFKICSQLNAISNKYPYAEITLVAPYLPYGRQDRIFNIGEASSFKLLIDLLYTSCKNLSIKTLCVHNNEAFFRYMPKISGFNTIIPIDSIFENLNQFNIVYPDIHASNHFYDDNILSYHCTKKRDKNSNIVKFECPEIEAVDLPTIIFDDLADGGGTFVLCANELKKQRVEEIYLFVTHGFFTKGIDVLFDAGIKKIITTDSVCSLEESDKLKIIKVKELM